MPIPDNVPKNDAAHRCGMGSIIALHEAVDGMPWAYVPRCMCGREATATALILITGNAAVMAVGCCDEHPPATSGAAQKMFKIAFGRAVKADEAERAGVNACPFSDTPDGQACPHGPIDTCRFCNSTDGTIAGKAAS